MHQTTSPILEAVHETAKGLHQAGVMDQVTLRDFDRLCLPPVDPLKPAQIKKIRERSRVSQAVFAALLNTSVSTVQTGDSRMKPVGTEAWLAAIAKGDDELERGEGVEYTAELLQAITEDAIADMHSGKPMDPDVLP